jgi:Predicted nucleotide-binding protein containing TIR-like domain
VPVSRLSPLCFIGSSTEGLPYAKALAHHLEAADVAVEQWNLSTFALGLTTVEALEEALARCSFAAFIATGDDKTISRGRAKISPRDNIVFEFGLFAGRLTRERTYLLLPAGVSSLSLPSDLLGVTVAFFTPRTTPTAQRTGMKAAADKVVAAIESVGPLDVPSDPALANELLGSVSRQLTALAGAGQAKLDSPFRDTWVKTVLTGALDPFLVRADDAYAAWLVPAADDRLDVAASVNLPPDYQHHRWRLAEGLAGRVWDTGTSAATSALRHHPWFVPRPTCLNEAYVCAVVGQPAGSGGVLAVGSDKGFAVHHGDEGLVRAYAAMLSLVTPVPRSTRDAVANLVRAPLDRVVRALRP